MRLIQTAAAVQRRSQFFVWAQSYLHPLIPHELLVCAAYQRRRRELEFESFQNVALAPPLLDAFETASAALSRVAVDRWIAAVGRAVVIELDRLPPAVSETQAEALRRADVKELLVHGVARPQRPAELESVFIFAALGRRWDPGHRQVLELVLPHLHATYVRVQATEREMGLAPAIKPAATEREISPITERERQILGWVREGKSNAEIALQLDISALTVKNHVQKILRKLGAANRAQAVACAMTRSLL